MSNQAVFLDRDGTLIEHYDYLTDASQVQLLPRTASALRLLKEHGYLLVLVTNQSAVARGMLTEETLFEIHDKLKVQLAEKGVYLDQIYYCPFHPDIRDTTGRTQHATHRERRTPRPCHHHSTPLPRHRPDGFRPASPETEYPW